MRGGPKYKVATTNQGLSMKSMTGFLRDYIGMRGICDYIGTVKGLLVNPTNNYVKSNGNSLNNDMETGF